MYITKYAVVFVLVCATIMLASCNNKSSNSISSETSSVNPTSSSSQESPSSSIVRANISIYTTANSSKYVYNTAEKFIEYRGYEDASLNSTGRASIDNGSRNLYYAQSSTYFNTYNSQVQDAYKMFQQVGQRP